MFHAHARMVRDPGGEGGRAVRAQVEALSGDGIDAVMAMMGYTDREDWWTSAEGERVRFEGAVHFEDIDNLVVGDVARLTREEDCEFRRGCTQYAELQLQNQRTDTPVWLCNSRSDPEIGFTVPGSVRMALQRMPAQIGDLIIPHVNVTMQCLRVTYVFRRYLAFWADGGGSCPQAPTRGGKGKYNCLV
jgi:hypothetical protein